MDLSEPAKFVGAKVFTRLAHRLRRDVKAAGFKLCARKGDGCYDPAVAGENSIEIAHLLNLAPFRGELGEHLRPKVFGNGDHAAGLP